MKISGSHLVATGKDTFTFAKNLNKGDVIVTYDYENRESVEDIIEEITMEKVDGYMAPLTNAGTILVNGVLASCFAHVMSHKAANTAMFPIKWWYALASSKALRLPVPVSDALQIRKQTDGLHWFTSLYYSFGSTFFNNYFERV